MFVVSDLMFLIYLVKIDRFEFFWEFFGEIIIFEVVYRECVFEGGNLEDVLVIKNVKWIKVEKILDEKLKCVLMFELDEGESEVIVFVIERNVELILIDDYDGWEVVRVLGFKVVGIIGIFFKVKFFGKIKSLREEFERLKVIGFWLSEEFYERILKEMGEF